MPREQTHRQPRPPPPPGADGEAGGGCPPSAALCRKGVVRAPRPRSPRPHAPAPPRDCEAVTNGLRKTGAGGEDAPSVRPAGSEGDGAPRRRELTRAPGRGGPVAGSAGTFQRGLAHAPRRPASRLPPHPCRAVQDINPPKACFLITRISETGRESASRRPRVATRGSGSSSPFDTNYVSRLMVFNFRALCFPLRRKDGFIGVDRRQASRSLW